MTMDDKDAVYRQRNELVIFAAKLALLNGWDAGWAKDDHEDWDDEWRTVVYIDTPEGQVCWHMDPPRAERAQKQLPEYDGEWDGTWFDTHSERMKALTTPNN